VPFFSHEVGSFSAPEGIEVDSNAEPTTISNVHITGPDAGDFEIVGCWNEREQRGWRTRPAKCSRPSRQERPDPVFAAAASKASVKPGHIATLATATTAP
jgi:hypothetical protein